MRCAAASRASRSGTAASDFADCERGSFAATNGASAASGIAPKSGTSWKSPHLVCGGPDHERDVKRAPPAAIARIGQSGSVAPSTPDHYTDDHRRLLDHVSEQAAAVIANSITYEQTREDSLSDPLTGLPNTRFLFMHLSREISRAQGLKTDVTLMVMDLDNFKDINDSHGHHVGDRAPCEVAKILRLAIRPYDICVRYAGDEFIIVLSDCSGEEAERKKTELQETIDAMHLESRPGKPIKLGISVGAGVFPHDLDDAAADRHVTQDRMRIAPPVLSKKMSMPSGAAERSAASRSRHL